MAETEFGILAQARLGGRNGDEESLAKAVNAGVLERNVTASAIDGCFAAEDDRRELHCLYPCHSRFHSTLVILNSMLKNLKNGSPWSRAATKFPTNSR